MGIAHIHEPFYRRVVVVLLAVPTFFALWLCNVTLATLRTMQETGRLVRGGWTGEPMRRDDYSKDLVDFGK